jgi:hypothetical protein
VKLSSKITSWRASLAVLTPCGALLCSAALPLLLAARIYFRLESAAQGAPIVSFGSATYKFTIPTDHLLSVAFWGSTQWLAEGLFRAIHAPALLVDLVVSLFTGGNSLLTPAWVVLVVLPLFALPGWWFVGRGCDGLLKRTRIRVVEMVVSAVLITAFLGLAAMLRFGLSAAERDGRAEWYMYGFTLWSALISAPLFAWIRQRRPQFAHDYE